MKFLFDLFPVLLFFIAYKVYGIFVATGVAIVASFVQIGWLLLRGRKVDPMLWLSLLIIAVFGGATIWLQNETFIKWKPTVLYWLFGVVLAVSVTFFHKNLIRALMAAQLELPDDAWARLNWSWVGFFIFMGIANLYVAYNYTTDTWVNFKLFGGTGLMLVFIVAQAMLLSRYVEDKGS